MLFQIVVELSVGLHDGLSSMAFTFSFSLSFPVGGTGHRPDLLQEAP